MVEIESFLAIEATLQKRLSGLLKKATKVLYRQVDEALSEGDFETAETRLRKLNLEELLVDQDSFISYITDLATLFGASRVTPNPAVTMVGLGADLPATDTAILGFKNSVIKGGQEHLIDLGTQLIKLKRDSKKPASEFVDPPLAETVTKAVVGAGSVLQPFVSFMDEQGEAFMDTASSLHTSRLSAYGFTVEADVLGIEEYKINEQLDSRICPVCRIMHNKVFPLTPVKNMLDIALRTVDKEDLKKIHPWPKNTKAGIAALSAMTTEDLINAGFISAPFHPRCRGLLGMVDKVKPLGTPVRQAPKPSTVEDFAALGRVISSANLARWNAEVGVSPSLVVAQMKGITQEGLLAGLVLPGGNKVASGITQLRFNKAGIRLVVKATSHGSPKEVTQSILFGKKTINLDGLVFGPGGSAGLVRKHLRGILAVARETGAETLTTKAFGGKSVQAMVSYGFSPSKAGWDTYRATLKSSVAVGKILASQTDEVKAAFALITSSPDQKDIFLLADSVIGKEVMRDTSLDVSLGINDPESMARFLSFIAEA